MPKEDASFEEISEEIENYCLNKAMDEAKESPLLSRKEALDYLEAIVYESNHGLKIVKDMHTVIEKGFLTGLSNQFYRYPKFCGRFRQPAISRNQL